MIYGIGTDLVHIKRMERVIRRWGDRFIHRTFTSDEIKICYGRSFPPSAFALRFAAKEAFSKAVGLGMRKGVRWRDIEVFHFTGGRPGLRLHGRSSDICQEEKITGFHVSLSDEGEYAVAMVVLEKSDEGS
ncbi:MAG: holo-ACP synthase [Deltaproteobacteria bacterium]|nr:holo-ACP synthase [Deltaproteobacteria bacterium]MBL7176709.1 holo-ACP synthase [Desulfobacteraceae bacterium]